MKNNRIIIERQKMALGFNQANLIFATKRKAVVERRAMGLVNDKTALAAESASLSSDYQKQQNARKLVWEDRYGVQSDLRYSNIVQAFNGCDYNYAITDTLGRMVLTSGKAQEFGVIGASGEPGDFTMSRDDFLAQFTDPSTGRPFNPKDYPFGNMLYNSMGAEATEEDKPIYTSFSDEMVNAMRGLMTNVIDRSNEIGNIISREGNDNFFYSKYDENTDDIDKVSGKMTSMKDSLESMKDYCTDQQETINSYASNLLGTTVNVAGMNPTVYADQYAAITGLETTSPFITYITEQLTQYKTEYNACSTMIASIDKVLPLYNATVDDLKCYKDGTGLSDNRYDNFKQQLKAAAVIGLTSPMYYGYGNASGQWRASATGEEGAIWTRTYLNTDKKLGKTVTNIMEAYGGSSFENLEHQNDMLLERGDQYTIRGRWEELSGAIENLETANPDFEVTGPEDWVEYYDTVWKHLKTYGWIVDDMVYSSDYLEENLRNGSMYIEKQTNNQTYSFSRAAWQTDGNTNIVDIRDTVAVNQALVEFEERKAELDAKEAAIDVDIQRLDVERASLETEITTIKEAVSKNVDRTFKMFQA